MTDDTATRPGGATGEARGGRGMRLGLCLLWSASEPRRAGEVAMFPRDTDEAVLGRGGARAGDSGPRFGFAPARPGHSGEVAPLSGHGLSRTQLIVRAMAGDLRVSSVGQAAVRVRDRVVKDTALVPGDVLVVEQECALLAVARE